MLDEDGKLYLIDFGFSEFVMEIGGDFKVDEVSLGFDKETPRNAKYGTPGYYAPEVLIDPSNKYNKS